MNRCRLACVSMVVLLTTLPGRAGEDLSAALDPDLPYQATRSNPVTYDVDFSVVVTAPHQTRRLQVWLPLPRTDAGQEVTDGELGSFPLEVTPQVAAEPEFGNRFAYFEFDHPKGAQIIRHRFQVKVWELRWNVDPAQVVSIDRWPDAFDRYLRSEQSIVVDERFRTLVREIVSRPDGPAADLAAVMAWVNDHLRYDHDQASLAASSVHALQRRAGHCSDYHGLCAALGRALGYPTRVVYGINPFPKNSPSHCKLEAYLPPYGWVSFDVSETQRQIATIEEDAELDEAHKGRLVRAAGERLRRGFRDNTWFAQTTGTDYDLAPPASRRVPLVRTIYAEADGVPLPEPDPANSEKREFAWMTVHRYVPDREVTYPFEDWRSLETAP